LNQVSGFEQDVLFEQVGRMLVMFTEGLIQTLGGRTHIKSEFRLDQTMIRPAENNPFKFSTSKTRTLLQLLSKSDPAYKSGVNAIREGFDDVNAHQIAVVAGMEAALQDILDRFNPNTLEKRLVSDSILDNILPGGKKAKYWDIFRILFDEIAGEAEDNFQQLFGREFSRAYEEQLSRLKNTRKE
jgi:type VI secretion system protein